MQYTEHLVLERLEGGLHWAQLTARVSVESWEDAWLLAAPLWRLGEQHGIKEVEVSLARGRWRIHGTPSTGSSPLPPPGLLLKAQFQEGLRDTEPAFRGLVESLGGLLGVPLARVTEDGVVAAPLVGWFGGRASVRRQVYAALPHEGCCRGHLAAWTNLLPCRRVAGLTALLNPGALAAAPYLSLRLALGLGDTSGSGSWASANSSHSASRPPSAPWMELTVSTVLPARISSSTSGTQASAGSTLSTAQQVERVLQRLLSRPLPAPCEAAASTALQLRGVALAAADSRTVSAMEPSDKEGGAGQGTVGGWDCDGGLGAAAADVGPAGWVSCSVRGSRAAAGGAAAGTSQEALLSEGKPTSDDAHQSLGRPSPAPAAGGRAAPPAQLQVVRHIVPSGLTGGTLVLTARVRCDLHTPQSSSSFDSTQQRSSGEEQQQLQTEEQQQQETGLPAPAASLLHVFQVVPWQLPILLSTLGLRLDGQVLELDDPQVAWHQVLPSSGPFVAGVVELLVKLPPCAQPQQQQPPPQQQQRRQQSHSLPQWQELRVAVGFRTRLLSVFQHAPDASRGVDIPAATSSHSAAHLVPLPVPDLSMPFNVCCFTSTLLAVYFGGMLNALLRPPQQPGLATTDKKRRASLRAKLRRVLAIGLVGGGLAFYLDKDLQRHADSYLHWLALGRESHPAGEL
ncbi:hypothetical protein N2152v2_010720 [Parachlorella kessleri]